jgi:hypothetical protein
MKRSVLVIYFALVLLDSSSRAEAHPLDSPGTVYIDGVPCNIPCQAYMAWSRRVLEGAGQLPPYPVHRTARGEVGTRHALSTAKPHGFQIKITTLRRRWSTKADGGDRLTAVGGSTTETARTTPSAPATPPQSSVSQLPPDSNAPDGKELRSEDTKIKATDAKQPDVVASKDGGNAPDHASSTAPDRASPSNSAVPPVNGNAPSRQPESQQHIATNQEASKSNTPRAEPDRNPVKGKQTGAENKPITENKLGAAAAQGETPSTSSPPSSDTKVAEAKPTDNLAPRPSTDATDSARSRALKQQIRGAAAVAAQLTLATTSHTDRFDNSLPNDSRNKDNTHLVALVLARSEITSVADLAGKTIATDDLRLSSDRDVRTALVAAGATDIQIHGEGSHAVDQLVEGQVPAAILTVVSQDAAAAFPDVLGFKLFAIPLSPSAVQGKTIDP